MDGRATLKLWKPTREDSFKTLRYENYEVMHCDYSLSKTTDRAGKVNSSDIKAGNIVVALSTLPDDHIMAWVFDASRLYSGEITTDDGFSETLEKIYFEEARPVGFRLHYEPGGGNDVILLLTINAQRIMIGESEYQNKR